MTLENVCWLISRRKIFATFVDTALLNGELNQIIFRNIFWFLWFLFFGLVDDLINYGCKEAYCLAFCMDNKFHFAK